MAVSMSRMVPRSRIGRTQPPAARRAVEPLVVVVAGGAVEQLGVEGPGARPGPRAVDQDGGQGQRRGAHAAGLLSALPAGGRARS